MNIYTRKSSVTGNVLTVAPAEHFGLDPANGKWVTSCDTHGTSAASMQRHLAVKASGLDFCADCRKEAKARDCAAARVAQS